MPMLTNSQIKEAFERNGMGAILLRDVPAGMKFWLILDPPHLDCNIRVPTGYVRCMAGHASYHAIDDGEGSIMVGVHQ